MGEEVLRMFDYDDDYEGGWIETRPITLEEIQQKGTRSIGAN